MPENWERIGNVILVKSENDTIELSLTCRCSIFQPVWQVYEVDSDDLQERFTGDLRCINESNPVDNNCDKETRYLGQETPNVFLLNSYNFIISQTTALMCFSDINRQVVIISVSGNA